MDTNKYKDVCYLAYTHSWPGVWGGGATIRKALGKMMQAGAGKTALCGVTMIIGDPGAQMDGMGRILSLRTARKIEVLKFVKVGALTRPLPEKTILL